MTKHESIGKRTGISRNKSDAVAIKTKRSRTDHRIRGAAEKSKRKAAFS